jgi:hypothetical protein
MKLLLSLIGLKRNIEKKTLADYQQEMYSKWGRQQFRKLNDLGLNIPVQLA